MKKSKQGKAKSRSLWDILCLITILICTVYAQIVSRLCFSPLQVKFLRRTKIVLFLERRLAFL